MYFTVGVFPPGIKLKLNKQMFFKVPKVLSILYIFKVFKVLSILVTQYLPLFKSQQQSLLMYFLGGVVFGAGN